MKLVDSVDVGSVGFVDAGNLHQGAEITTGNRITLRKPNVDDYLMHFSRSIKAPLELASKLELINHFCTF